MYYTHKNNFEVKLKYFPYDHIIFNVKWNLTDVLTQDLNIQDSDANKLIIVEDTNGEQYVCGPQLAKALHIKTISTKLKHYLITHGPDYLYKHQITFKNENTIPNKRRITSYINLKSIPKLLNSDLYKDHIHHRILGVWILRNLIEKR